MTGRDPNISVVLATYERADDLDVVLAAFADQRGAPAEVVVADDGSGDDVRQVVERWKSTIEVRHVWQPKEGFRKARALDRAALTVGGDYLVFLDADCIPRRGFLDAIRKSALPGRFLATKRLMLGDSFSRRVVEQKLPIWRWSASTWLLRAPREVSRPGYLLPLRDGRRAWRAGSPEFTPPELAYSLIGVARADFERVNGYDARCRRVDDGEDQDLAIRLRRTGLRCGWAGPASTVLHLWHPPRSYRVEDRVPVFRTTEREDRIEAIEGLREIAAHESANRVASSSSSVEPVKR